MNGLPLSKRFPAALLCILIVIFSFAVPAAADPQEKNENNLTVGVPENRCPIFYRDSDTGEPVGIGVDLMRFAAAEAGFDATFQFVREANLKEALDNTDYDVVMPFGSAVTSASGQPTVVSDNLMQTPFTFVTIGNRELPPLDELRVGMVGSLGAGIETLRKFYPDMEISTYDTMGDCVKALRDGKVDALLHNSYVWSYVLQKPSYSDLVVQPSTVFSMDFRAGTTDTPEGRATIERLNDGIAKLDDTKRQAYVLDYTSRSLYRYELSDYLYQYGLVLLLTVLLFAALIVIAVQIIRAMRKEHEEEMKQMLEYDPLTGVYSMNGFRKRVEELLITHPDAPYFLSYNNIRGFKFINDSLGREAGDELLRFWAAKSLENLSTEEAIGRITADRFAVLRHITTEEKTSEDVKYVFEPVQNFFLNQGKKNRVQICSGIYILTAKDFRQIDVDHMLDLARVAEKRVSDSRKTDFAFYNPEQWEKGKRIADVVNFLPLALQAGNIQVWYQPQVDYEKGKIIGAEALCRWDHDKLGWIGPSDFISTLEEAGLIFDLDQFVWDKVCQDLQRWNEQGYHRSVSVNLSRGDVNEERDIPGHFHNLIKKYGLTPDQLRIEITETAYVESTELLVRTTERLRELGFKVEMDDFGSGYSSLHMLKEVPVDRIKLDLHFLTASGDSDKCRTIVSCMINMVDLLGMEMIAEGVETIDQAKFLKSQGCNRMQGYYFYRPMPVGDFEKILSQNGD